MAEAATSTARRSARHRRLVLAATVIVGAIALVSVAVAWASYPPMPTATERVLERDWCSPAAYVRARHAAGGHLSLDARRNLYESQRAAEARPRGCRLALRVVRSKAPRLRPQPSWTRRGRRGAVCPRAPLPLGAHWRHGADVAALQAEGRRARPVLWNASRGISRGEDAVVRACGRRAAARTVTVDITLTRYLPSASLSESVLALARFPGVGWRVWMILH
jgi:hypothetical protein